MDAQDVAFQKERIEKFQKLAEKVQQITDAIEQLNRFAPRLYWQHSRLISIAITHSVSSDVVTVHNPDLTGVEIAQVLVPILLERRRAYWKLQHEL